jgi:hypothetical protein
VSPRIINNSPIMFKNMKAAEAQTARGKNFTT